MPVIALRGEAATTEAPMIELKSRANRVNISIWYVYVFL